TLLEKLKKDIPDVTAADLDRWTQANEAQQRVIDGELRYFNREPSNIYRFSEEAKKRRATTQKDEESGDWTLVKHLANVVAEAEKTGNAEVVPIKHRLTYSITVDGNRPGAKAGSIVRCWMLFPQEYRQQRDVKLVSAEPAPKQTAPNGSPHRTIYFEQTIE